MPLTKVREFLDKEKIRYVVIMHSPAYTAQEIAQSAHIPGREVAKTVVVNIDGELAMAVLPASKSVNLSKLADTLGAETVELASEQEFIDSFSDCEVGAMPPFGNLYGLKVYVAKALTKDEEIAFNAGSHTQLIKMAYKDFERLVKPEVVEFAW